MILKDAREGAESVGSSVWGTYIRRGMCFRGVEGLRRIEDMRWKVV